MKTNKFEDTIRWKLESIEPDFQEKDWANMQRYMRAQSPPSFWQQHSSWIGYAAAASVSMVMAFMYVSQRTQNNHLTADVKKLQHQIEAIKNAPTLAEKPDTVYLIKKGDGSDELIALSAADNDIPIAPKGTLASRQTVISRGAAYTNNRRAENFAQPVSDIVAASSNPILTNLDGGSGSAGNNDNFVQSSAGAERLTMPAGIQVGLQQPVDIHNNRFDVNKMKYNLVNRISKHQYQQALLASNIQKSALPASGKKTEQVAQAETIIPKLDLKVPYRFGAGIATDGVGKTKSVNGEVLIARKFSISAGISWLKVKPMEFFNEKLFREKSRRDFRGEHPGEVPVALKVYNIRVDPTVVQIPLTVAFRNNIKDNWAYYAGAGTNFTVSAKEKVSFDAKGANYAYMNQHFEAKSDVPLISSVNLTMGLEKTWYPIVVQAEGYLYAYFNQLTPLSQSAGPGVKVKLMYQIGGKM
ncbi:hypothetical protein LXM25_08310 [Dyadobacter sp. LJ53]|uniref:hypothetical protein n=1 Tax=Dyadobacter chenwenxiniae TaxID=2906456 RepID=UPI001F48DDF8|nr:hypothetical protein [Dyadobacter chenwenxiniae]MCF0050054.1 hypothetical protein [Dyadobacter chenwenxiniae]